MSGEDGALVLGLALVALGFLFIGLGLLLRASFGPLHRR